MSNSTAILAELNTPAFDAVRDEIRKSYLESARGGLAYYQKQVAKFVPTGNKRDDHTNFPHLGIRHAWTNWSDLVVKGGTYSFHVTVNGQKFSYDDHTAIALAVAPLLTINEEAVIKDADKDWTDTKLFYAARVGEKADLIGGDGSVKLNVTLNRELTGHCVVVLGKKALVLETSLKTNYRYGENSANGDLTIYRQVPTVIVSSNGFDAQAAQVDVEQAKLQAKLDKKSALIALAEKLHALEKRKRHADDLAHTLDFVAKYSNGVATGGNVNSIIEEVAALGLTVTPSVKESKLIVKELREAIKSVKAEIKAVKTTK